MKPYCLELAGDFACFTRPEMKVERVSYDVMTPSAARACFESILWRPAICWHIRRIEILKPIRWVSLRRNEVGNVASVWQIETAMKSGEGLLGLNIEDERQQRAGLFLRDVAYRVHADLEFLPSRDLKANANKYYAMFTRRASTGQCINQPYLGCREFAAQFRLIEDLASEPKPINDTRDLGFMLHDLDFTNPAQPTPKFFHARLEHGVVEVPALCGG